MLNIMGKNFQIFPYSSPYKRADVYNFYFEARLIISSGTNSTSLYGRFKICDSWNEGNDTVSFVDLGGYLN